MAYDPYSAFNAPLPGFSQFKPRKTRASSVRAFNQGVQQNRNLQSGPSQMMQTAAQYGGGWSPAYQSVYETAKSSWSPYGTDFAKTKADVDRQMALSASRQSTGLDLSAYRPGQAQPRTSSDQYSAWGERPSPLVVYRPPETSNRRARRVAADEFLETIRGMDPGQFTDEQIEGINQAYRDSGISHAPTYSRGSGGEVVRTRHGQAGVSRQTYMPPPQMPAMRPPPMSVPREPGFSSAPPQLPDPGFTAQYRNFDGTLSDSPNYALRDAFAQNINSAMMPYYQNSGTYLGEGSPPPTWGQPPQFNFPQLYRQATNMVAGGYQNPLAGLFG